MEILTSTEIWFLQTQENSNILKTLILVATETLNQTLPNLDWDK